MRKTKQFHAVSKQVNMEKAKEKDDPTGTANPGIFMRLKSNILNRLPAVNIPTLRVTESNENVPS